MWDNVNAEIAERQGLEEGLWRLQAEAAGYRRHCALCDEWTDQPSGYCLGCQEALDDSSPDEREVDPDVAFHYARRQRWSQQVALGQRSTGA